MNEISGDDCFRVLDDNKLVLFYFTASWCGPCQKIFPKVKELSEKISQKVSCYKISIDDDENEKICEIFKVESVPSFYLLKNKECINTLKGADINGIKKMLNIKD